VLFLLMFFQTTPIPTAMKAANFRPDFNDLCENPHISPKGRR